MLLYRLPLAGEVLKVLFFPVAVKNVPPFEIMEERIALGRGEGIVILKKTAGDA